MLNIYQDKEIDRAFEVLDKADFCVAKPKDPKSFNPYSLDP